MIATTESPAQAAPRPPIAARTAEFSLEIYPSHQTFAVGAAGLSDGLGFAEVSDLIATLPPETVHSGFSRAAAGQGSTPVVDETGFRHAIGQRTASPIADEQEWLHIRRFVEWVDGEVIPLLGEATGASIARCAASRPTMTAAEVASALFLRHGWDWGRNELGHRLHSTGVLGADGAPTAQWRDAYFRAQGGWALLADALPRLEDHLAGSSLAPPAPRFLSAKGPAMHPLIPDISWRAPNAEPEPPSEDDERAALIDDLMRHLPGPDGSGPQLGIIWRAGKATGDSIWREHLPGFHREIRCNAGCGDLQFRRKLASRVWNLLEFGHTVDLPAAVTSRIVYDFLVSVAYDCETRS